MSFRAVLVLAAVAAFAQENRRTGTAGASQSVSPPPPPQAEVKPEDRCTIEGSVVNARTGEAVKKAQVNAFRMGTPGQPLGVLTDGSGKFKFANLEPGRYSLSAFRNGYAREQYGQRGPDRAPTQITLEPRQVLKDIVFRLTPAAVITGRVVDEDGEPMVNARVQVLRYRYFQGRRQLAPVGGGQTDDVGNYRIHSLASGRYFVSATYSDPRNWMGAVPPPASAAGGGDEGYVAQYYPGVFDAAQATALQLQPGQELRGVDFKLLPTRTVRVRGRVLNAVSGRSGRDTMVGLMPRSGPSGFERSFGRVDNQGNFEIRGVTPGSYTLVAFIRQEDQQLSARVPVEVASSGIEGLELTLKAGVELRGQLRVEGAADPKLPSEDLRVFLRSDESTMMFGSSTGSVEADGRFTLKNVGPGEYHVALFRLPEDYYIKSVRFGEAEVTETPFTVSDSSGGGLIDLVLSPDGGKVEGGVFDDKKQAVTGATVVLVPEPKKRNQTDLFKTTTTDQYGRFALRGVPPGEYKLFAWDSVEPGAYQDPAFLEPFENKAATVRIQQRSQETAELTVLPAAGR